MIFTFFTSFLISAFAITPGIIPSCTNAITSNLYKAGTHTYNGTLADPKDKERLVEALIATGTHVEIFYSTGKQVLNLKGVFVTTNVSPNGDKLFNFLETRVPAFHNDLFVSNVFQITFKKDLFPSPTTHSEGIISTDISTADTPYIR